MKVCFIGFTSMDYKGEETNEVSFLKGMINDFSNRGMKSFYLYNEGSNFGLNNERIFNLFQVKAKRLCIDQYSEYKFGEYKKYSREELERIIDFNQQLHCILHGKDDSRKLLYSTIKCLENIREYDEKYQIDLFILWGNSLNSHIIRAYCTKNNKKFINMENGYFRPFTLMVDHKGVNYESSIPREQEFYENLIICQERYDKYLRKPEYAFPAKASVFSDRELFYKQYGFLIERNTSKIKKEVHEHNLMMEDGYIYVPFQLETDSQIIKYSSQINSMLELVRFTSSALEKYNKFYNKNMKIIYKVHPLYKNEIDIMDLEGIRSICEANPNLIFLTEGNNKILVKNSKAVITINSTVGIEALTMYKPVITLGDTFYNIEGIAYNCKCVDKLEQDIFTALTGEVNKELIDKFLYYLRFNYFVEIYKEYPDEKSINRLVDRMLEVTIKDHN